MLTRKETRKVLVEWKNFLQEGEGKKIAVVDLDGTVFEKGLNLANIPEGTVAGPIKYFALSSVESLTPNAKSSNGIFNGNDEIFTDVIKQVNDLKKQGHKVVMLTARSVPNFADYKAKNDPNLNFVDSGVTLIETNGELLNKLSQLVRDIGLEVDEIYPLNAPEEGKKHAKKAESYKKDAIINIVRDASEVIIFEDDREIKVALQNKLHKELPDVLVNFANVGPAITDTAREEDAAAKEQVKTTALKVVEAIFGEGTYVRPQGRPSDTIVKMRDILYPAQISSEEDDILQSVIKIYTNATKKLTFKDFEIVSNLKDNKALLKKFKAAYKEASKEQGFTPEPDEMGDQLKESLNKLRVILKNK